MSEPASSKAKPGLASSKVKKLVTEESGGMRISSGAIPEATEAAVSFLHKIGARAGSIARSHGRKTIMEEDIIAARKQLWGE